MTWAQFKDSVVAFINRSSSALVTPGTTDLVVIAANMAKTEAQRRHHFKMARTQALISSSIDGADLSTTTLLDGSTAVAVKKVEQVWLYTTSGSNKRRYVRIPSSTLGDLKFNYPTGDIANIANPSPNPPPYPPYGNVDISWYIQGTKFYLPNTVSPVTVWLDVVKWMPDYDGSISDFFITYHFDWMILKTVQILNRYLKDSEQVYVPQAELSALWTSVVNFDENFAEDNFEAGSTD